VLNKNICKKCWNKGQQWEDYPDYVVCSYKSSSSVFPYGHWLRVGCDEPPNECPYILEHLMENQKC